MPIAKYTASADTTITNAYKPPAYSTRATGSNMGAADATQVFSIYGQQSSSVGLWSSVEKSRALVKFAIDDISSARSNGNIPASGSVSFYLDLSNARTPFTLPKNYTLRVQPVLRSWDEGSGLDMDTYIDAGYSNWIVASSTSNGVVTNWTTPGGDFEYNSMFEAEFPVGNEDMSINITSLVEEWLGVYNSWSLTVAAPLKFTGSNVAANEYFGYATAISGDGLTASFTTVFDESSAGTANVYESGSGVGSDAWTQTILSASDKAASDGFGRSVDMTRDGKTIVVGAASWEGSATNQGSIYVFTASADWAAHPTRTEAAHLSASDGAASDQLGWSCAISADDSTIVAGAQSAPGTGGPHAGAAYVFVKDSNWSSAVETLKLSFSDQGGDYGMGRSCAISADGSVIVVGAPNATASSNDRQGALYVYQEPSDGWSSATSPMTETATLTVNTYASASMLFGYDNQCAISDDGATIVGATELAPTGRNVLTGAAYVFVKPSSGWATATETSVLEPFSVSTDDPIYRFGASVDISGDGNVIAVGDANSTESGSVFIFEKPEIGYVSEMYSIQRLTEANTAPGGLYFGFDEALNSSGTYVSVGEYGSALLTGSGFIFERPTGTRPNYGVGVFLKPSQEDGSEKKSYYIKKFFARSSEYFFKRPIIEARWDDSKKDDRGDFYLSSSLAPAADNLNTLYLYNYIRGKLRDIPAVGTNNILVSLYSGSTAPTSGKLALPAGGGVPTGGGLNITGSWVSTGIYSASFATTSSVSQVPTYFNRFARSSDTVIQYLYDVWHSGSVEYFTGSGISPKTITASPYVPADEWVTVITNLKSSYKRTEEPRFRIFTRPQNWSPNIYTVATTAIQPTIIRDAYYKIVRVYDNLDVVPYGTGSIKYTQLSYDSQGSYFDFNMDLLEAGYSYAIKVMSIEDGIETVHPETFKFRVE